MCQCVGKFVLYIHRVIKKFSEFARFCSKKRHIVHLSAPYIGGSSHDIPQKISSF